MSSRLVTFIGFRVIVGLAVAWGFVAIASHRQAARSGHVVGALARSCTGRIVLLLVWAWLGWHHFARGSGAFQ